MRNRQLRIPLLPSIFGCKLEPITIQLSYIGPEVITEPVEEQFDIMFRWLSAIMVVMAVFYMQIGK
jgi:hypothetical protein